MSFLFQKQENILGFIFYDLEKNLEKLAFSASKPQFRIRLGSSSIHLFRFLGRHSKRKPLVQGSTKYLYAN